MTQYPPYSQQPPPLYVAQPAPSNGLGIAGFIVSLVGLLSCGLLSPIGLLLSLIAVFKHPRGFAISGLILGFIGCAWAIVALFAIGLATIGAAIGIGTIAPFVQTEIRMAHVAEVVASHKNPDGSFPTDLSTLSELSSDDKTDTWGNPLRVVPRNATEFDIVSDGPDRVTGTSDDLKSSTFSDGDRPHVKKRKRHSQVD